VNKPKITVSFQINLRDYHIAAIKHTTAHSKTQMAGSLIILIFAVLSIVAGGGWLIGLILGVIGGILGLLKK
jgi:hypothetical protein